MRSDHPVEWFRKGSSGNSRRSANLQEEIAENAYCRDEESRVREKGDRTMSHGLLFSLSIRPILAAGSSNAALFTFLIYTLAVFGLAALSNQSLKSKNFLSEYFLGSRSLGVWAFALTFAATSASGGSFTGFPSKIYTHGWVLGL
jgi:hypothetical protein